MSLPWVLPLSIRRMALLETLGICKEFQAGLAAALLPQLQEGLLHLQSVVIPAVQSAIQQPLRDPLELSQLTVLFHVMA